MRVLLVLGLVAACGTDTAARDPATWYGDVGALVHEKCAGCHRPGGIAPFSVYDAADAQHYISEMLVAIDSGIMPPWFTNEPPDCTPRHAWRDDVRIRPEERQLLGDWLAKGTPLGTERKLPEPPETTLENPTTQVTPVQSFTSSGDRDQFVCFLFDPGIDASQWLVGAQVTPTAPTLVHHANLYLVDPSSAAAAMTQIGGLGVPKLGCDNPPGMAIMSWLPGNPALVLPNDVGIPPYPASRVKLSTAMPSKSMRRPAMLPSVPSTTLCSASLNMGRRLARFPT